MVQRELSFFVDRSMGTQIVPTALRRAGWRLKTMDERYGVNESMKVQDVDWIGEASRRGEAILCKDKAVASVPLEAQTIYMNDARVFAMASGRITGQEMIRRLLVHQDGIFRWASMKPGPFVCGVHADRIARLKLAYL